MKDAQPKRVALFATHPIQYQVPWFRRLAACPGLDFQVFFGMIPDAGQQGVGFDLAFEWDIPLLEGYPWMVLENASSNPGLGTFGGCSTPGVGGVLRDWRPDVAILTGWHSQMMLQALWACLRLRIPRLVRGESNAILPRQWLKRTGHRMLLKRFDAVLAIGKANRSFYEMANVPAERIFDCPYFVDNERFSASAAQHRPNRAELRAKWQIPTDACCFLFAGKLIAKKRPLDLIAALAAARDQGASVHLLMVGTGELLNEAKALAARDEVPVTFAGFLNQSEIPEAYVAADCLVLPSDAGETWGLVVNEAMASGIPAIVSDQVGCGSDLVITGETGAIYPLGDIDALARKIVEFAIDPNRVRSMGRNAQERVLTRYTVDRAVEGTLAAIRAAIRK